MTFVLLVLSYIFWEILWETVKGGIYVNPYMY